MRTPDGIIELQVYWDRSGDGWAERITYDGGHQESGPNDLDDDDSLAEAVVNLGYAYGLDIDSGSVAIHREDGGCGVWTRAE